MSHRLFLHSIFSNARVWAFLKQVDEAEAQRCRSAVPLSHAEDLKLQELSIEKAVRWSVDLVTEAPPERRRINLRAGPRTRT